MAVQYYTISFSGVTDALEIYALMLSVSPVDLTLDYVQNLSTNAAFHLVSEDSLWAGGSYESDTRSAFSYVFRVAKSADVGFSSIAASGGALYALFEDDDYRYGAFGADATSSTREISASFTVAAVEAEEGTAGNVRSDACFMFLKNGSDEFRPATGASLHFASKDTDTLTLPGLPAGTLEAGDSVTVRYRRGASTWKTVFVGTVERIVDRHGRGAERVQDVACQGPWGKMNRLVFRQTWGSSAAAFSSPRVILNQSPLGVAYTLTQQVNEILAFAASKCGFSIGTVDVDASLCLPKDETRDMTCASALQRELRFFPKKIVRFDYSAATPAIHVSEPASADDAAYVADIPKTAREYEYTAHPITGVDVYTNNVDTTTGEDGADEILRSLTHQIYPADCNTDDLDILHAYIPLQPGSASTSWESFESETEDLPSDLRDKSWWKAKHPRLANVAEDQITVNTAVRMHHNEYPRIAKATAQELRHAGLHYGVERFRADVTIKTADDEEENILLTMDFLMTDAKTKTYTWQTGSSSTSGESLPAGLAEAIFKQRSGTLRNETMTVRLGDALPTLGDVADGLCLQSFDVDCYDLTATLNFGQPEYLSVEDMRDLLNGFRGRGYASNAPARTGDEDDEEDAAEEVGGVPPLSSSDFAPGTKAKTTIKSATSGKGTIVLDSAEVPTGSISVHTLTFTDKDGKADKVYFLASSDFDVEDTDTNTGGGSSGEDDDTKSGASAAVNLVTSMAYDTATHELTYKYKTLTFEDGLLTEVSSQEIDAASPVFTAVAHESGMD